MPFLLASYLFPNSWRLWHVAWSDLFTPACVAASVCVCRQWGVQVFAHCCRSFTMFLVAVGETLLEHRPNVLLQVRRHWTHHLVFSRYSIVFPIGAWIFFKSVVFWGATLCSSERAQCFRETYHFHLQGSRLSQTRNQQKLVWRSAIFMLDLLLNTEDGGSMFL